MYNLSLNIYFFTNLPISLEKLSMAPFPAMPWYRRTKLVFDSLRRNINPKIIPRSHLPSRTNPAKFYGFSSIASRELGLGLGSLGKTNNPFLSQAKRNYCSDRHFKPRRWTQDPLKVLLVATAVMIGSHALIILYFGNFETVPYTKRTHFLLVSKSMENRIGETLFEQMKKTYKGKILPANHPESIRVRLIAKEVIDALQRGLSHERAWSELGYASMDSTMRGSDKGVKEMEMALSGDGGDGETMSGTKWSKDDEIQQSRKKDTQAASSHLEGINWEVLVVNEPMVNAFCFPAGKIVVFTGLLNHFKSDAEVATVIGHEVGHAVARHAAEGITNIIWRALPKLMLFQNPMPDLENTTCPYFLSLPLSRKMEIEADYIGLLLLASAGYDPRIAPKVYEKLGKLRGDGVLGEYLATHPSGEKRSQLLAQANVMEEALTIYREVQSGRRGIEGFL
uniref:Mitochondrial metalloendopeptidase OMA1 n=1 Tax=Noccaea caerulescens TaxID=107243 RepID=A0A1J3DTQ8_NOCCA